MGFYKCFASAFADDFRFYVNYYRSRYGALTAVIWTLCDFGFIALSVFRFGKAAQQVRFPLLRRPALFLYFLISKLSAAVTGIHLFSNSTIGRHFLIHNFGGIIIRGTIGDNVTVVQGVQLVSRGDGKQGGWPTVEDHVYLGAGAVVLGNVVIGARSKVGANCVVRADVPPDSIVLPPDPVIVSRKAPAPDG
jgi:serine O-acetyltransferase